MESEVLVTQVSWIVSMHDACMPLLASLAPNKSQKYGRIVTIVGRAWCCCGPWFAAQQGAWPCSLCTSDSLACGSLTAWLLGACHIHFDSVSPRVFSVKGH